MQRDVCKKGFTLSHERFVLDIDPTRRFIRGSAELTIQPLNNKLTSIRINCRQCAVLQTTVNGEPVEFSYADPVSSVTLGENTSVAHHHVYKSKYLNALREADEGELSLKIPEGCIKQMSESEARLLTNDVYLHSSSGDMQDDPTVLDKTSLSALSSPTYAPLIVRVDFILENPSAGLVFIEPDDIAAPYRYNHIYTVNQPLPGATRAWLPCIDKIHERCTWDMEFIVPNKMGSLSSEIDNDDIPYDEYPTVVVCSGEVVEQVIHPFNPSKKIVHYSLSVPTAAPFIGFAIGPFEMIKFTPSQLQEEMLTGANLDENQRQSLLAEINMMSNIYAFALPGREEELNISCNFLMHAMHYYAQEYGSYPFSDYKLVFVEDAWSEASSSASLAICSTRLLHPPEIIDQTYTTRRVLSLTLARQWFGIHIVQKSWPDVWLIHGMASLMGALFIKRHLGNSEFRLRLKKDMEMCCSLDVNRPPLYNPALLSPIEPEDLEFIELKAPLVLYMLDKRMCKVGATLGLSRVIPKILVSAMSGELAQNALSTHYFLRLCRKVSGFDTKTFADQWIYRSGCPKFTFSFHFNRKKMVVEFYMRQENTNSCLSPKTQKRPPNLNVEGGIIDYRDYINPLFTGNLTVRIHEADGTPYEHILDIQSEKHKFEVQFNTKYKRIRRNTKRFLAKQAAAAAAVAEEDAEKEDGEGGTTNVLGIIPALGLGMPVFEDPQQREKWKVVEWGQDEEDTSGAASAMFDWIRLDADFEWVCTIDFQQPDYMWASQLTKDRDVVAQYEAIEALKHMPSLPTATSLLRALLDPKCFYKIRMEAAYALAKCGGSDMNWVGLHQLYKMFQSRYCFPSSYQQMEIDNDIPVYPAIPKPNNFSNLPDYFVQKGVVIAFSQVRDQHGVSPVKVRQFLLDLLKYNDNIGNEFSDSYYVASIISSLGDSFIPISDTSESAQMNETDDRQLLDAAISEIERFRTLDCVIPSYHNVVTVSCLKTLTKLMLNGILERNLSLFLQYTRYGNYLDIRICAFDSLFMLAGMSDPTLTAYYFSVLRDDPCPYVAHHVARAMLACLGPAMRDTPEVSHNRFVEEFSEEEGKAALLDSNMDGPSASSEPDDQVYIENLRKQFENDIHLRDNIWELLNSTRSGTLDHCLRKHLLQLCEYLYKPADVGLKVTIRMPPLVQEVSEDLSEPPTPLPPVVKINKIESSVSPKEKDEDTEISERQSVPVTEASRTIPEAPTQVVSPPRSSLESSAPTVTPKLQIPEALQTTAVPKLTTKKPEGMPAMEFKKCRRILSKLQKHRSALPFLQPVDEQLDGAPDYYKIIKKPMDLGTIRTKFENGEYTSYKQLEDDLYLMFSNCFVYNGPGTFVYNEGKALQALLEKELANIKSKEEKMQQKEFVKPATTSQQPATETAASATLPPQSATPGVVVSKNTPISLPDTVSKAATLATPQGQPVEKLEKKPEKPKSEMEKCTAVLAATMENRHAFEFLRPVDPIKQGIPHYYNIIKKPIDLGTIKSKLKTKQYTNAQQFDDDIRLMFRNCFAFNPPNTYVYNEGKMLEEVYCREWRKYFGEESRPSRDSTYPDTKPPQEEAAKTSSTDALPAVSVHSGAKASTAKINTVSTDSAQENPVQPVQLQRPRLGKISASTSGLNGSAEAGSMTNPDLAPKSTKERTPLDPRMNDDNMKRCDRILKKLWQHPASQPFYEPVDAEALNIPQYYEIIKRPMDLSAVRHNLEGEEFSTIWEFERDIRQIFWNCYRFNDMSSWIAQQAKDLEACFNENWCAEFGDPDRLSGEELFLVRKVVGKLMAHDAAPLFNEPVDTEIIPEYTKVIKTPMDLRTISEKLESGKYTSLHQVDADIRQVFTNCFTFNKPGTYAYDQGKRLEKYYNSNIGKELRHRVKEASPADIRQRPTSAAKSSSSAKAKSHPSASTSSASTTTNVELKPSKDIKSAKAPKEPTKHVKEPRSASGTSQTAPASTPPSGLPRPLVSKLESLLNRLMANEAAIAFLQPVDPIALQIPHYPLIIKKPMDLGTVQKKLRNGEYKALKEVEDDIRLIFTNCYTFNGFDHPISQNAKVLERIFNKDVPGLRRKEEQLLAAANATAQTNGAHSSKHTSAKASGNKASSSQGNLKTELKKYKSVLDKLQHHPSYYAFGAPVDPVLLQIPTYFDVIKHPMDFGTIRSKLEQGKYTDSSQLLKDAQQVFVNCYTFNLSDDIVYHMGQEIEAEFNKLCAAKGLKGVEVSSYQQASEAVEQPTYAFSDTTSVVPEISGTKRSLEIYDDEDQDSGMDHESELVFAKRQKVL